MATTPTTPGMGYEEALYRGAAMSCLRRLKDANKGLTIFHGTYQLPNGVEVFCNVCGNREDVYVRVPAGATVPPPIKKLIKEFRAGIRTLWFSGPVYGYGAESVRYIKQTPDYAAGMSFYLGSASMANISNKINSKTSLRKNAGATKVPKLFYYTDSFQDTSNTGHYWFDGDNTYIVSRCSSRYLPFYSLDTFSLYQFNGSSFWILRNGKRVSVTASVYLTKSAAIINNVPGPDGKDGYMFVYIASFNYQSPTISGIFYAHSSDIEKKFEEYGDANLAGISSKAAGPEIPNFSYSCPQFSADGSQCSYISGTSALNSFGALNVNLLPGQNFGSIHTIDLSVVVVDNAPVVTYTLTTTPAATVDWINPGYLHIYNNPDPDNPNALRNWPGMYRKAVFAFDVDYVGNKRIFSYAQSVWMQNHTHTDGVRYSKFKMDSLECDGVALQLHESKTVNDITTWKVSGALVYDIRTREKFIGIVSLEASSNYLLDGKWHQLIRRNISDKAGKSIMYKATPGEDPYFDNQYITDNPPAVLFDKSDYMSGPDGDILNAVMPRDDHDWINWPYDQNRKAMSDIAYQWMPLTPRPFSMVCQNIVIPGMTPEDTVYAISWVYGNNKVYNASNVPSLFGYGDDKNFDGFIDNSSPPQLNKAYGIGFSNMDVYEFNE